MNIYCQHVSNIHWKFHWSFNDAVSTEDAITNQKEQRNH
jgi:hypothetical protein